MPDADLLDSVAIRSAAPKGSGGKSALPPRAQRAWNQYQAGLKALDNPDATDNEVYDALWKTFEKEARLSQKSEPTLGLPERPTWGRNLRIARQLLGKQKHHSRSGRAETARSIVKKSDL